MVQLSFLSSLLMSTTREEEQVKKKRKQLAGGNTKQLFMHLLHRGIISLVCQSITVCMFFSMILLNFVFIIEMAYDILFIDARNFFVYL
jgi:hypothetical protein